MEATISKWGNSLGIRIPSLISKDLKLEDGSRVLIEEENNRIVIYPKSNSLDSMLNAITEENMHSEIETGSSVGNESW
jgi:antitoxin MazE